MLMDAALPSVHGEVLDVCTGSGVAALLAAPRASSTTAVDASRSAVWAARTNAALNGRRVRVLHGDLFRPVADRRFDVILCNPPYLPVPDGAPEPLGSPAWDGGPDGRRVLDCICEEAVEVLRPGGALFLVQSVLADYERTLSMLTHVGLDAVVAARHTGPLGPLARRHAGHLRAIGAMPRQDEEIVVVCAMQTAARWRLGATHGRVAAAGQSAERSAVGRAGARAGTSSRTTASTSGPPPTGTGAVAARTGSMSRMCGRKRAASVTAPPIAAAPTSVARAPTAPATGAVRDRKSTRLNSSHMSISYAVFCLKKKKKKKKKKKLKIR